MNEKLSIVAILCLFLSFGFTGTAEVASAGSISVHMWSHKYYQSGLNRTIYFYAPAFQGGDPTQVGDKLYFEINATPLLGRDLEGMDYLGLAPCWDNSTRVGDWFVLTKTEPCYRDVYGTFNFSVHDQPPEGMITWRLETQNETYSGEVLGPVRPELPPAPEFPSIFLAITTLLASVGAASFLVMRK
jgi:hypothetical protein